MQAGEPRLLTSHGVCSRCGGCWDGRKTGTYNEYESLREAITGHMWTVKVTENCTSWSWRERIPSHSDCWTQPTLSVAVPCACSTSQQPLSRRLNSCAHFIEVVEPLGGVPFLQKEVRPLQVCPWRGFGDSSPSSSLQFASWLWEVSSSPPCAPTMICCLTKCPKAMRLTGQELKPHDGLCICIWNRTKKPLAIALSVVGRGSNQCTI
jgi:hypothetical protein